MCLVSFAYKVFPDCPILILSNRDEFWDRPTESARFWQSHPGLFGGRDLQSGGTWLGVTRLGKISFLTNVRNLSIPKKQNARSRGLLVSEFLQGSKSALEYAKELLSLEEHFEGFNLFLYDGKEAVTYGQGKFEIVKPGWYSVSNGSWDSLWPKTEKVKEQFQSLFKSFDFTKVSFGLEQMKAVEESFFSILSDTKQVSDTSILPNTGIGIEKEKALSSLKIELPGYGTRCSTLVASFSEGFMRFRERNFNSSYDNQFSETIETFSLD